MADLMNRGDQEVRIVDADGDNATIATDGGLNVHVTNRPDDLTVTGSGSALNATPIASTSVSGYKGVTLRTSGTFSATLTWEVSFDGGTTWDNLLLNRIDSGSTSASTSTTSSGQIYGGQLAGGLFRGRISSYTSGTVVVEAVFTSQPFVPVIDRQTSADRATFTDGSTQGMPVIGVYNDALTDPTSGQQAAVRITQERALHSNLRDSSGAEVFPQTSISGHASALGVVTNLTAIDGINASVLDIQHRGVLGQFKFTTLVEGTDDPSATGSEAAGAASTAVGWTSLELRSASGARISGGIVLGGRYLLFNPPRKVRIRVSSYTFGSARIDVMVKSKGEEEPGRFLSDQDSLARLAMTTFGQMQVAQRSYLTGGNFDGASLDTGIWSNTNANGGSHTFANGVVELHTGTSSNGKGGVRSVRLANFLGASDNAITIREATSTVSDGQYVYRFGVYSDTEGTFIQLGGNARTFTDGVFNSTTAMTSTTAAFTAADLGRRISAAAAAAANFTADASANTILSTSHGLTAGRSVTLTTTGTLPAPLNLNTTYWVITANTNDFQLALVSGGPAIDLTDTGSGTHSYAADIVTPGTTIVQVIDATQVTLSAAAQATISSQSVTVEGFGVAYVNRKAGVDTTSTFGIIGFTTVTPAATAIRLWEITFNPNFLIIRSSGSFVQLQIGGTVLSAMFNTYSLPLTAEALNVGSTSDHILYLQTHVAERLGQPSTIRADETFESDDVLSASASIIHGRQSSGSFIAQRQDGPAYDVGGVRVRRTTDLSSSANWTSGWVNTRGWGCIKVLVKSNVVSAANGVLIEFTDDTSVGTVRSQFMTSYSADEVSAGSLPLIFNTRLDGYRISYTNGGTGTTGLYIDSDLQVVPMNPQNTVKSNISATSTAVMGRNAIFAENDGGSFDLIKRSTSTGALRVSVKEYEADTPIKALTSMQVRRTSVGTSAVEVTSSSPLTNRKTISIKAIASGSNIIYIGHSNAVTSSTGYPLSNEQSIDIEVDATVAVWAIASSGGQAVSVLEVA